MLAKDIEIIFMTDSVDEYTVQHLTEFEGKRYIVGVETSTPRAVTEPRLVGLLRLINASREGLKLDEGEVERKREEQYKEMFKPLIDFMKETLGKKARP